MRKELEQIEQIEAYLMKQMDHQNTEAFEAEMRANSNLAANVAFQKDLMEGFQNLGLKVDAQKAYGAYKRMRLLKWMGAFVGVIGLAVASFVLLSNKEVAYCNCAEIYDEIANVPTCVDTCKVVNEVVIDEIKEWDISPKVVVFEALAVKRADEAVVVELKNNSATQVLNPAFEMINTPASDSIEPEFVDESVDIVATEELGFYYETNDFGYYSGRWQKSKSENVLQRIERLGSLKAFFKRKKMGSLLSQEINYPYYKTVRQKNRLLRVSAVDNSDEVVNTVVRYDSVSNEVVYEYDTIPAHTIIPPLRVEAGKKRRLEGAVKWIPRATQISENEIDLVLEVWLSNDSYIFSQERFGDYNMPTQIMIRNTYSTYEACSEFNEFGFEYFEEEKNYQGTGPVKRSNGNSVVFRQRIRMDSDSLALQINYAYMVGHDKYGTSYPMEDSIGIMLYLHHPKGMIRTVKFIDNAENLVEEPNPLNTGVEESAPLDREPMFQGEIYEWLNANMDLDEVKGDGTLSGAVLVGYTVSETGKVINVEVLEGLDPKVDAYVVSVIKKMPDWLPGYEDGKPISVDFSIPVNFKNL